MFNRRLLLQGLPSIFLLPKTKANVPENSLVNWQHVLNINENQDTLEHIRKLFPKGCEMNLATFQKLIDEDINLNIMWPITGCVTDKEGTKTWYVNGLIHRENGPAVIMTSGSQYWIQNGEYHRENEPAVIMANGQKEWWHLGERHRENKPAVIHPSGYEAWYKHGLIHREDGPAVTTINGRQLWFLNGKPQPEW